MTDITAPSEKEIAHATGFEDEIKLKSDRLINYFLPAFFATGLLLAPVYDTWNVALGIGIPLLSAYYISKLLLPDSNLYQYVLGSVLGLFMAQFIYQMHGMFEMHFFAFIGSAILITYQNWKLQITIATVVIAHHAIFGYLQYSGMDAIYFSQLDFMDIETFAVHGFLASVIFVLCGAWSYDMSKYANRHIKLTYELGKLQKNEEQNKLLRKTNLELDKFAYSVSHDLRAPLLSMQGIVELTSLSTEEELTRKHMEMLMESVGKLDTFISDIHHYSRNARMAMKLEPIDFEDLLSGVNQQLAYMNGTRPVDIQVTVDSSHKFVSDKYRVQMVMNNLVSNAIRYQNIENENPFVKVLVSMSPENATITVKDNGIGINDENYHKIFDMFYRVSDQSKGSGLGLYIVKETVDVLQGSISLESEVGTGTTFVIKLPNNAAS
ncbi:HAMP domain-containing sensor histidine kinase [Flavobacterium sp.]|uniref:sensor histidine kinase n=1 Tax=Flavobacterium sp. TaxID=239 RepID=UPI001222FB57|nr:HAMP domain-containing sensor histidine kinase [Flavobacterium sp.]RZJ70100.1 MAG: HAMP domain-containing histidine kinase [Flavobacterium sp.]